VLIRKSRLVRSPKSLDLVVKHLSVHAPSEKLISQNAQIQKIPAP
jgi:hypothetical protein